jgi:MoaA/NifB/PqqE/SkfB family radical SAM enzyme
MTDKVEWVVWNGSFGILDQVTIGRIEHVEGERMAYLADPYGVVGPFSLDALESEGRIAFGECLVMSRARWKEEQVELRREGREKRRAFQIRFDFDEEDDQEHRKALDLPMEGDLDPAEIKAAFRRLAKTAHPDAGGSDEHYRRIAEARDALLERFASAI